LARPIAISGTPGIAAPIRNLSSQMISLSYQKVGMVAVKCGSLASIGLPVDVCLPDMTQLLLCSFLVSPNNEFSPILISSF